MWPFKKQKKLPHQVGEIITIPNEHRPDKVCVWKIRAIHLGAEGHEDLVSLERLDASPGSAYGQVAVESLVPMAILDALDGN